MKPFQDQEAAFLQKDGKSYNRYKKEIPPPDPAIFINPKRSPHPKIQILTTFLYPEDIENDYDYDSPPLDIPAQTEKQESAYEAASKRGNDSLRKIDRTMFDIEAPTKKGKFVTFVFSFEMLNTVLANMKGRAYGDEKKIEIINAMYDASNIKTTTKAENENFSNDLKSDTAIMNALNEKKDENKILTTKKAQSRLLTIWSVVQKINLPNDLKQHIGKQFSQIKDKSGNVILQM